jgi:SAM-dependent methyltransferase
MAEDKKTCRVCKKREASQIGDLERGGAVYPVYECRSCKSRFCEREAEVFDDLHSVNESAYSFHTDEARRVHGYFTGGDLGGLRNHLCRLNKNRFIIKSLDQRSPESVLEIGCSKGYLTSYSILRGYDVIGVDISESAVRQAGELFGTEHFMTSEDFEKTDKTFDFIYHVGTIGCVDDPAAFIKSLMERLNGGGVMLFNVPDVNGAKEFGKIWVRGSYPPDLITLFDRSFIQFVDGASVSYEPYDGIKNFYKHLYHKWGKRDYFDMKKRKLLKSAFLENIRRMSANFAGRHLLRRIPDEFGMFVTVKK